MNIKTNVAVIILTLNEELNLPSAIASVKEWAQEILVLDSGSVDKTLEIAEKENCTILTNKFVNYATQRNFALDNFIINAEWVLFLDADERLTDELKAEITALTQANPSENGFYIKRRMLWMGQWIKRGYYPTWILRLFRYGKGRCEDRAVNEHLCIEGNTGYLNSDFIHDDYKNIGEWIKKHNHYATLESLELIKETHMNRQHKINASLWGTPAERKRWLRQNVWQYLPKNLRGFIYFIYCYILTGAFLEGRIAFLYHFFHAWWYRNLIDAKYLEKQIIENTKSELATVRQNNSVPSVETYQGKMNTDIAVIILTLDEELNLPYALASVKGWAKDIFVVDSFSSDNTVQIAQQNNCIVLQNKFVDYSQQFNYAIDNCKSEAKWLFFLDADEYVTAALRNEINQLLEKDPIENAFLIKWQMFWLGQRIKRGYYTTWVLRLCRNGMVKCEERSVNEHFIVKGEKGYLKHEFIHCNRKSLGIWINKHDEYAGFEALELIKHANDVTSDMLNAKLWGTQVERKRWIRHNIWNKLPKSLRPFIYFFYRYIWSGAFLEGKIAFLFHFFHALWYPILIDAKYLELEINKQKIANKLDKTD